jgi:hypothetical protein
MPPIITAPAHRPHHPERPGLRAGGIYTVKTAPGAVAVQIVYASRRNSRSIAHLCPAHDDRALKAAGSKRAIVALGRSILVITSLGHLTDGTGSK